MVVLLVFDRPAHAADTLLQAVTFALTGSDIGNVSLVDRSNCIYDVAIRNSSNVMRYHLNNIDLRRATVLPYHNRFNEWTQVELRGPGVIYEFIQDGRPTSSESQASMHLGTSEAERVKRAWSYIYTHGCRYSPSPF